jgi:hypothetical protein
MSTTEKLAKALLACREALKAYNLEGTWADTEAEEALAAHEADKQRESGDEREAFEAWVEREAGPGADQDNRAGWVACLNWQAGRASAQAVPAGMVLVSKRSIEALNEWAGDSQFYPNQPESKLVNPLMHRVMQETDAWLAAAPKGD